MPKPISKKHQAFIKFVVSGMDYSESYRQGCGKLSATKKTSHEQGSKLARRYAKEITTGRERAASAVEEAQKQSAVKTALKSILSQAQVDARLCSIIDGNFEHTEIITVNGKPMTIKRKPNPNETAKAIDLYYKRFGANAPTKIAQTDTGGKDILPSPTINVTYGNTPSK